MRRFVRRHQPPPCRRSAWKAALGSLIGIGFIAWLGDLSGVSLLIAPFGATCVLLFALPDSPLSQPANVIGGHLLSTAISLVLDGLLPDTLWATAVAVGVVILVMGLMRLTHPPAGADPLVVMHSHPGAEFLLVPMLAGSIALVIIAVIVHRLPPRTQRYPLPEPSMAEATE